MLEKSNSNPELELGRKSREIIEEIQSSNGDRSIINNAIKRAIKLGFIKEKNVDDVNRLVSTVEDYGKSEIIDGRGRLIIAELRSVLKSENNKEVEEQSEIKKLEIKRDAVVKVKRTSGEIDDNWVVFNLEQKDESGDTIVVVHKRDEQSQGLMIKRVPLSELENINKEVEETHRTRIEEGEQKLGERIAQIESEDNELSRQIHEKEDLSLQLKEAIKETRESLARLEAQPNGKEILEAKKATYDEIRIAAHLKSLGGEDFQRAFDELMPLDDEVLQLIHDLNEYSSQLDHETTQLHLKQVEFCVNHFKLESLKLLKAESDSENSSILQAILADGDVIDSAIKSRFITESIRDDGEFNLNVALAGLDYIDWSSPENNKLLVSLIDLMEEGKIKVSFETNKLYISGSKENDKDRKIINNLANLSKIQCEKAALEYFSMDENMRRLSPHERYGRAVRNLNASSNQGLTEALRLSNNEALILTATDLISRKVLVFDITGELVPNQDLAELDKNDSDYIDTASEYKKFCREVLETLKIEQQNMTESELGAQIDRDPAYVAAKKDLDQLHGQLEVLALRLNIDVFDEKPKLRARSKMKMLHFGISESDVSDAQEYEELLGRYLELNAAIENYEDSFEAQVKLLAKAKSDSVEDITSVQFSDNLSYALVADVSSRFEVCVQKSEDVEMYRRVLAHNTRGMRYEARSELPTETEILESLRGDVLELVKSQSLEDILPDISNELIKNGIIDEGVDMFKKEETIDLFLKMAEPQKAFSKYQENTIKQEAYLAYLKALIVDGNIDSNDGQIICFLSKEVEKLKMEKLSIDVELAYAIATTANKLKASIRIDSLLNRHPHDSGEVEGASIIDYIKAQVEVSNKDAEQAKKEMDKAKKEAKASISESVIDHDSSYSEEGSYSLGYSEYIPPFKSSRRKLASNKMKQKWLDLVGLSWLLGGK